MLTGTTLRPSREKNSVERFNRFPVWHEVGVATPRQYSECHQIREGHANRVQEGDEQNRRREMASGARRKNRDVESTGGAGE